MSSKDSSLGSSRAPSPTSRLQSQATRAEEVLKSQTVGLVHLSDFRKRQAEALKQHDGDFRTNNFASSSGSLDAESEDDTNDHAANQSNSTSILVSTTAEPARKRKRKSAAKSKLSFGIEDEEEIQGHGLPAADLRQRDLFPCLLETRKARAASPISSDGSENRDKEKERRLGPDKTVSVAPKVMTKSALMREAQTREKLRKDFLALQEAVKSTEIVVPFVFYDGTNVPGGKCKVKKGDFVWVLLDRGRRVGAGYGSKSGERSGNRKEWARIGVDDLLLVRGDVIIPHHYELYYFIVNKIEGPGSRVLFDYSDSVPSRNAAVSTKQNDPQCGLSQPSDRPEGVDPGAADPASLQGNDDDPTFTKVVDRRWYERNKHIYPASIWQEFDPSKNYRTDIRRDGQGNAYYFN